MSEQESKLYALYQAVHLMMARLGADGEIDTRAPEVDAVMDAMHEYDGGQYIQWNRRTPQPVTPDQIEQLQATVTRLEELNAKHEERMRRLGEPVTPAGGEVAWFEGWAHSQAFHPTDFERIEGRPANRYGQTWEYNGNYLQAAWAAWTERATHPPVADAALLARAERLHSAIVDAISIHSSFNTTADMADWLHDELDAARNQRGGV